MEVEELPTQTLLPRSRSRVPLTGAIAAAGLAILLAAGFGLLGGRGGGAAAASPASSSVAQAPSPTPAATQPQAVPRVTPWVPCGSAGEHPPSPVLEVDGDQHLGRVEVAYNGPEPGLDGIEHEPGDGQPERVDVPMDAVTEIWISGGRCAIEWTVGMADEGHAPIVLESVVNEALDPAVSSQNRFEIFVAPYAGDFDLRAILYFDDVAVRATWPIHVPELVPPQVSMRAGERPIQTAAGCDVTQRLANELEERLNPCERDVQREPARRAAGAPGARLTVGLEGWGPARSVAYWGQLTDRRFIPRGDPPCFREHDPQSTGLRFRAPDEAGAWTLAVQTCATRLRATGRGFEELCGTWYANLRVRD